MEKKNAPDRVRTSDLQIFSLTLLPAELQELTIKRTKKDRLGLQVRSNRQKKQSREKVRHIAQENKRRVGRYVCMSVCKQGYIHRHRKRGRRYGWYQEQVVRVYSHIYDSHISVRYICMYSMYIKVYIWVRKNKKEWFHPGSIRGPSPRQDDVITNYTMKPF